MSKKSKIIASLLSITLLGSTIIGCGLKKETNSTNLSGEITIYTSQPEEDIQKLIEGFNKKVPNATVNVFRSGTEEVVSKILAEKEANAVQADLLLVAASVTFESLKSKDLLTPYKSSELEGINSNFIDKDNMYTGTKIITTGIIYNTDLCKEEVTSFKDLTNASLKDNTIIPSPLYSGAAAYNVGVMSRNNSLTWDYFQNLKSNGIKVDKGNGAILKAVSSGQKAAGLIVDYMAIRAKNDGSPVKFVYPSEGSPAITEPIGIVKGSKNEDLAKAFVDYVLSTEGQTLASEMGYTPIKSSVKTPEGLKSISELKTISSDSTELLNNRESDKLKFSSIFN